MLGKMELVGVGTLILTLDFEVSLSRIDLPLSIQFDYR